MQFAMRPAWGAIALLVAIEAVAARLGRLDIDLSGWALPLGLIGGLLLAGAAYGRRAPPVAQAFRVMALWLAFILVSIVLSYLCARLPFPTRDAGYARVDRLLGFRWLAWTDRINARAWARLPLTLAYFSLIPQACLLGLFVVLARGAGREALQIRLAEFFWIALLGAVATSLLAGLVPALGVPVAHGIVPAWLPDLLAMRHPGPAHVAAGRMTGLISFPSYHALQALLLVYSARGHGWRTGLVALLNMLMLAATLSTGGHYLVDTIGGAALFFVCLAAVRGAYALVPGFFVGSPLARRPLAARWPLGACLPHRDGPDEETAWLTNSGSRLSPPSG